MKIQKKSKYLLTSLLIIFFITGCEKDLLEQVNPNAMSTASFWKTGSDAYDGLIGIYSIMPASSIYGGLQTSTQIARDDAWNPLAGDLGYIGYFAAPASHWSIVRPWQHHYRGIYRANEFMSRVPDIVMDETDKTHMLGEAYFLRGYYYFFLLNVFHNIPLITEVPQSAEDYYPVQAAPEAIWEQIESDLKQAQSMLPDSWDTQNLGRATWGAATGFLGKSYLYQQKWSEAATEFQKLIGEGIYDLVPDYSDNFTSVNKNNIESLFEVQLNGDPNFPGFNGEYPSRGMASVFGLWLQAPKPGSVGLYPVNQWLVDTFLASIDNNGDIDQRAFATVLWDHPDCIIYDGKSFQEYYPVDDINRVNGNNYVKKWIDYEAKTETAVRNCRYEGEVNWRILRFADVLLMYAEAVNESSGPTADAYTAINRVRQRANVPDITPNLSKDDFRDAIKHERILELSLEGIRFFDLLRWGDLEQAFLFDHPDCKNTNGAVFTSGRDEYLPIPQGEIDAHPQGLIKQNPGY